MAALGAVFLVALPVTAAAPAAAHVSLVSATPADGSTTARPPGRVELVFSEDVEAQFAQLVVLGPDAAPVTSGAPVAEGTAVSVGLGASLPPGEYAVSFRVVSADGHPVAGELRFRHEPETTAAARAPVSSPVPDATAGASAPGEAAGVAPVAGRSDQPRTALVLAPVLVVAVGLGVVAFRRSRSSKAPSRAAPSGED